MNDLADLIPLALLVVLALSLGAGVAMVLFLNRELKRTRRAAELKSRGLDSNGFPRWTQRRPQSWLVIRSQDLPAVQTALGLQHARPCSWQNGLAGDEKLFIAPPVDGWILVTGSGLPDPSDDVDVCFRFVAEVSRKLGHVLFFSANQFTHHHAWVRVFQGHVIRAYAWAGTTVWNQGMMTFAEKELGLKCFNYTESPEEAGFEQPDVFAVNAEKVPLLAARWSFDPAHTTERFAEQALGVAGEPSSQRI